MTTRRFRTAITVLGILAGATGLGCQGSGTRLDREELLGRAIQGEWHVTSTITSDGCNLGSASGVGPIGGPFPFIFAQFGTSIEVTEQICTLLRDDTVIWGFGSIAGGVITVTSFRTIARDANCSYGVNETDVATFDGEDRLTGEATLHVFSQGDCGLPAPCEIHATFVGARCLSFCGVICLDSNSPS